MTPRPILKSMPGPELALGLSTSSPLPFASCSQVLHSPHVHFPPTPRLTSTETTHSPFVYDRAPIVVSPNQCALPERGGRVYKSDNRTNTTAKQPKGSYFHPHAFEVCEREPPVETKGPSLPSAPSHHHHRHHAHHDPSYLLPSLTPDVSPDTSDSDTPLSSPPPSSPIPRIAVHFTPEASSYPQHNSPIPRTPSQDEADAKSLLFLPYLPSPVKGERTEKRRREREKEKEKEKSGRRAVRKSKMNLSFCEPSVEDGCLGGF